MNELLSDEELDVLLSAISNKTIEKTILSPEPDETRFKTYDFERPEKFSKEHLKVFQEIFEAFTNLAEEMIQSRYGIKTGVKLSSLEQVGFEDYIKSIVNESVLSAVQLKPLPGIAVLEATPGFCFGITDTLLSGKLDSIDPKRVLSELESPIINDLLVNLLQVMENLLNVHFPVKLVPEPLHKNYSSLKHKISNREIVLEVILDTKIGDFDGNINLCIPYSSLESVIHNFTEIKHSVITKTSNEKIDNSRKKILSSYSLIEPVAEFLIGNIKIKSKKDEGLVTDLYLDVNSGSPSYYQFKTGLKKFQSEVHYDR